MAPLCTGGGHGFGRYRLAQAQPLHPFHTGAVGIAPAIDVPVVLLTATTAPVILTTADRLVPGAVTRLRRGWPGSFC